MCLLKSCALPREPIHVRKPCQRAGELVLRWARASHCCLFIPASSPCCAPSPSGPRVQVGEVLERGGGRYLVGGRFTAADLTFAAMSAIVLMPPQYGAYLPPVEAMPSDFPALELRETPAGRHAMRMYELHRRAGPGGGGGSERGDGAAREGRPVLVAGAGAGMEE
jgi:hypothetical protein